MKKIGFYIRIEVGEICNSLILKRKNAIVKKILEWFGYFSHKAKVIRFNIAHRVRVIKELNVP